MYEKEGKKLNVTLTQPPGFFWSKLLSISFQKVRWRNTVREENWWWGVKDQKISCVHVYLEPSFALYVELHIGCESIFKCRNLD